MERELESDVMGPKRNNNLCIRNSGTGCVAFTVRFTVYADTDSPDTEVYCTTLLFVPRGRTNYFYIRDIPHMHMFVRPNQQHIVLSTYTQPRAKFVD